MDRRSALKKTGAVLGLGALGGIFGYVANDTLWNEMTKKEYKNDEGHQQIQNAVNKTIAGFSAFFTATIGGYAAVQRISKQEKTAENERKYGKQLTIDFN